MIDLSSSITSTLQNQAKTEFSFCSVPLEHYPLIDRFFAANKNKVSMGKKDLVFAAYQESQLCGALRLIPQADSSLLMRNLFVSQKNRGQGVASRLVDYVSQAIFPNNCYCYALPHLQDFYLARGYRHFTTEEVPKDIAELYTRYKSRNRDWVLMGLINQTLSRA